MTLYEIQEQFLSVLNGLTVDEDTGELLGADALDAIQAEFEEKAVAIGCYIKELLAESAAIKAEEQNLEARRKSRVNKAEKLKTYLSTAMQSIGKALIDDPKIRISFRPSASVEVFAEADIPPQFFTVKMDRKLNKKLIAERIANGERVPGAAVVKKQNLQIK